MFTSDYMVSSSRTYIARCNKENFDGYVFKKFVLPMLDSSKYFLENNADVALWYFTQELCIEDCCEDCFPAEDLGDAADFVQCVGSIQKQNDELVLTFESSDKLAYSLGLVSAYMASKGRN